MQAKTKAKPNRCTFRFSHKERRRDPIPPSWRIGPHRRMQSEHRPGLRGGPRKKASRDRVVVDGEAGQAERPSTCPAVLRESGGGRTHALFVLMKEGEASTLWPSASPPVGQQRG